MDPRAMRKSCFSFSDDGVDNSITLKVLEDGGFTKKEPEWTPGKNVYTVMRPVMVVSLLVTLDAMVLVPVVSQMISEFGGSSIGSFWFGAVYLLTCAIFQPFIASTSEIFGRREAVTFSIWLFLLGTYICAPLAGNLILVIVGRAIQGIGAAGIIAMNQVIFSGTVTLRCRPVLFYISIGMWALGSILGPLTAGVFVEKLSWKYCFYINFMLFGLGFFAVPALVKLPPVTSSLSSKLRRVDWIGACLIIGGLAVFTIGISWADIQFSWLSAQTWVPIVIGLLLLGGGIIWEMRGTKLPMMRASLFSTPSINILYACAFCHGLILLCGLIYIPFYFTAVQFKSPVNTALGLFPMLIMLIPGTLVVAFLAPRIGCFRWAIWIGWGITAGGGGLLLLFNDKTSPLVGIAILSLFGFGNGMVLTGLNVGIANHSKADDRPQALAMYAFFRTLGLSIGVAAAANVFRVTLRGALLDVNLPAGIAYKAEAVSGKVAELPLDEPVRAHAIAAFVRGFHGVFWFIMATAIFAFFISLFVKSTNSSNKCLEGFKFPWKTNQAIMSEPKLESVSDRETKSDIDGPQITVMLAVENPSRQPTPSPMWKPSQAGNSPRVPTPGSAGSLRFPSGLTMTPGEPATAILAWPDGRPVPRDGSYGMTVWGEGGRLLKPEDRDLNSQRKTRAAEWV